MHSMFLAANDLKPQDGEALEPQPVNSGNPWAMSVSKDSERKQNMIDDVAKFIAHGPNAVLVVENPAFREFVSGNALKFPAYLIPHRTTAWVRC